MDNNGPDIFPEEDAQDVIDNFEWLLWDEPDPDRGQVQTTRKWGGLEWSVFLLAILITTWCACSLLNMMF